MTEIQEIKELRGADSPSIYNWMKIRDLERALADARRDHAVLARLVKRMGEAMKVLTSDHDAESLFGPYSGLMVEPEYPYTLSGQREYDAAMHDAEGPDVRWEDCVP